MSNHTPGNWVAGLPADGGRINVYSDDTMSMRICRVDSDTDFGNHAAANARRIVACVNACEGVPIEVLEARQVGGLPWNVADQIDILAERHDLLEALQGLMDPAANEDGEWYREARAKALSAIAKATKG